MILGILHANQKRGKEAYCRQCRGPIKSGDIHAVIILRYGNAQKRIAEVRKKSGRAGLLYHRVHLQCFAAWVLETYMRKSEIRRERTGGRPAGSGIQLLDKDKLARKRLIRKRAELLRQIVASDSKEKVTRLYAKAKIVRGQIQETGVDICLEMARRNNGAVNRKLSWAKEKD